MLRLYSIIATLAQIAFVAFGFIHPHYHTGAGTTGTGTNYHELKITTPSLYGKHNSGNENETFKRIRSAAAQYEEGLDALYEKSFKIKCPFFRRRAFDSIESLKRILFFVVARHKSTPFFPNPQIKSPIRKIMNLDLDAIAGVIQYDWMGRGNGSGDLPAWGMTQTGKGYYITGELSKEIYDEECFFDGPDPDMPVKGLRKYLLSASQLFDRRTSRADLTRALEVNYEESTVTAYWRLEGVLNLPWHPSVKPWTGSTTYIISPETGLVTTHREQWDISVLDAFVSTLLPSLNIGAPAAPSVEHLVIEQPILSSDTAAPSV
mmetsp:Transcript_28536/g.47930  ORF Transcript_28536/g.47930 Transcript_28536/m.47930 type:complete len:320 (+) Transcript_28536:75-1034(+)